MSLRGETQSAGSFRDTLTRMMHKLPAAGTPWLVLIAFAALGLLMRSARIRPAVALSASSLVSRRGPCVPSLRQFMHNPGYSRA